MCLGSCNRSYDILVTGARNSLNIPVSVREVAGRHSGWNSSREKGRQLAKGVIHALFVIVAVFASFLKFRRHEACLPEAVGHALLYAVPGTRHHVYGPQLVNFKLGAHAEVHQKPTEESPPVPNVERLSRAVERLQPGCCVWRQKLELDVVELAGGLVGRAVIHEKASVTL
ncbi:hypothetical protein HPB48_011804 [Haemaphysalis longicornis]|uniref:Uncharacterized protein n=1 Tax=Haemaphysalis longicornis TaxID=44386 RepID=A0A9J6FRR7_HAELO|nr:hypothetical protein HPB48_011804 [Haemaphysalis longicornis]